LIAIVGAAVLIPESPLYLIKSGKVEKGKQILDSIAKFNKLDCGSLIENIDDGTTEFIPLDSDGDMKKSSDLVKSNELVDSENTQEKGQGMNQSNNSQGLLKSSLDYSSDASAVEIEVNSKVEGKPPVMFYLKQKEVLQNLMVMSYMWCACSFCFYMINYLMTSLPGSIFVNGMASSLSDVFAYALSGLVYN
jgi:hypothetical protein